MLVGDHTCSHTYITFPLLNLKQCVHCAFVFILGWIDRVSLHGQILLLFGFWHHPYLGDMSDRQTVDLTVLDTPPQQGNNGQPILVQDSPIQESQASYLSTNPVLHLA